MGRARGQQHHAALGGFEQVLGTRRGRPGARGAPTVGGLLSALSGEQAPGALGELARFVRDGDLDPGELREAAGALAANPSLGTALASDGGRAFVAALAAAVTPGQDLHADAAVEFADELVGRDGGAVLMAVWERVLGDDELTARHTHAAAAGLSRLAAEPAAHVALIGLLARRWEQGSRHARDVGRDFVLRAADPAEPAAVAPLLDTFSREVGDAYRDRDIAELACRWLSGSAHADVAGHPLQGVLTAYTSALRTDGRCDGRLRTPTWETLATMAQQTPAEPISGYDELAGKLLEPLGRADMTVSEHELAAVARYVAAADGHGSVAEQAVATLDQALPSLRDQVRDARALIAEELGDAVKSPERLGGLPARLATAAGHAAWQRAETVALQLTGEPLTPRERDELVGAVASRYEQELPDGGTQAERAAAATATQQTARLLAARSDTHGEAMMKAALGEDDGRARGRRLLPGRSARTRLDRDEWLAVLTRALDAPAKRVERLELHVAVLAGAVRRAMGARR